VVGTSCQRDFATLRELVSHKMGDIQVHYPGLGVVEKQHQVVSCGWTFTERGNTDKDRCYTIICMYRNSVLVMRNE
jgi:hypothetical protein